MKTYNLPNNSYVKAHDIFDELPRFMKEADCLCIDPPYNQGLYSNFINRQNVVLSPNNTKDFCDFSKRLFECIVEISPSTLFLEIGKEHLSWYLEKTKEWYKYVTFYNSTYYHRQTNKCYVIHATNTYKNRRYTELEDMDEEDIIKWVCTNHAYDCIGDLCMGTGLVGKHAYLNGKRFVGTELNPKRLAVLVHFIRQYQNEEKR